MQNVLVIDDERAVSEVLSHALNRFGYNVDTADNGTDGIEKFDTDAFDLVITDMCMSGVDGNGVARHIRRSHRKRTPIIAISGTPDLLEEGEFDAVLPKPFSLKALAATIKDLAEPAYNA